MVEQRPSRPGARSMDPLVRPAQILRMSWMTPGYGVFMNEGVESMPDAPESPAQHGILGFATVDRQPNAQMAIWLTSLWGTRAAHTNAVVTTSDDQSSIDALLARRILVLTPGTEMQATPSALTPEVLGARFTQAVMEERAAIDAAIEEHARQTGNRNLIRPDWAPAPIAPEELSGLDVPQRTLAVANYVAALWQWWIGTESERRRRMSFPAMIAAGLGDAALVGIPPAVFSPER